MRAVNLAARLFFRRSEKDGDVLAPLPARRRGVLGGIAHGHEADRPQVLRQPEQFPHPVLVQRPDPAGRQAVRVSDVFLKHCVELVNKTRESDLLDFGCSPRAGLALIHACRARAFMQDRDYVIPEDLFELAEDIVLHRMRMSYAALAEGHTTREVLDSILSDLS